MRKLHPLLILCFILSCASGFAQQKCTAKARNLTAITEQQNVSVSCFPENVATRQMFCLNFQNKGTASVTFSFTVKDKNGKIISTQSLTLAPGQTVNGFDNPDYNKSMVVPLTDDQT